MPAFDRKTHPREYLFQRCEELIDKINTASNDMIIMPLVKRVLDISNSEDQILGYILDIEIGSWQNDFPRIDIFIDTADFRVYGNIGPDIGGVIYIFSRRYDNNSIFHDIPRSLALREAGHAG